MVLNSYAPLAGAVAALVLVGSSVFAGYRYGVASTERRYERDADLVQEASEAFESKAAELIAKLRPIHQHIQGEIRETVRESTVYRDCTVDPATERLLDAARDSGPKPASAGVVSGVGEGSP